MRRRRFRLASSLILRDMMWQSQVLSGCSLTLKGGKHRPDQRWRDDGSRRLRIVRQFCGWEAARPRGVIGAYVISGNPRYSASLLKERDVSVFLLGVR